jgi:hypothetical protein
LLGAGTALAADGGIVGGLMGLADGSEEVGTTGDFVAEKLGSGVSVAMGVDDGTAVGTGVGATTEGRALGFCVGEGTEVMGTGVGPVEVGIRVGLRVGILEGVPEGTEVMGTGVGPVEVGSRVGTRVGF